VVPVARAAKGDSPALTLALAVAGLLLGRAAAGELAPLAIAFAAAALPALAPDVRPPLPPPMRHPDAQEIHDVPILQRIDPSPRPMPATLPALAIAIGATVGAATRVDMAAALGQAAGVLLAYLIIRYAPAALARPIWAAVLGAIPARIAATGGLDPGSLVLLAVVALLAAVLQAVFMRALNARKREAAAGERAVAAGILAGAMIAGIGPLQLGPVGLTGFATAIAALWLAQAGPGAAAAGCVALGAVAAATGAATPLTLAAIAVGGLAAGFASPYSRLAAVISLFAGEAVVTMPSTLIPGAGLLGTAAGCALVIAIPQALWPPAPGAGVQGPVLQRWLSERLRHVAAAVSEVGITVQDSAFTFTHQQADPAALHPTATAVDDVVRAVCGGCSAYVDCWDRKFMRAYRMVDDLLLLAETRPIRRTDVGGLGAETIDCLRPADMARGVNLRAALSVRESRAAQRVGEGRQLVATQMDGLAQVLEELSVAAADAAAVSPAPRRRTLRYEKAIRSEPRPGRDTSGDSYLVRELGNARLLVALSDGMGSGQRAATQSATAVTLLERLLNGTFPPDTAVRTVNAALLLREPEDLFATLDVIVVDLTEQTADFLKLGAPWGFHVHSGEVEVISPDGPPAGALVEAPLTTVQREIRAGDELILCTDGIVRDDPGWLEALLAEPERTADDRADAILARALEHAGADHDDMTVVVCRFHAV
jgi:stage II sporulation protein E